MRRIVSLGLALLLGTFGGGGLLDPLLFAAGWKGWMVSAPALLRFRQSGTHREEQ